MASSRIGEDDEGAYSIGSGHVEGAPKYSATADLADFVRCPLEIGGGAGADGHLAAFFCEFRSYGAAQSFAGGGYNRDASFQSEVHELLLDCAAAKISVVFANPVFAAWREEVNVHGIFQRFSLVRHIGWD